MEQEDDGCLSIRQATLLSMVAPSDVKSSNLTDEGLTVVGKWFLQKMEKERDR